MIRSFFGVFFICVDDFYNFCSDFEVSDFLFRIWYVWSGFSLLDSYESIKVGVRVIWWWFVFYYLVICFLDIYFFISGIIYERNIYL